MENTAGRIHGEHSRKDSSKTQEESVSEKLYEQIDPFDWDEIDDADPFDRLSSSSKADNKKGTEASLDGVSGEHQIVETSISEEMKGEEKGSENVAQDQPKLAEAPSQGMGALVDSMPGSSVVSPTQSRVDNSKAWIAVPSPKPVKLDTSAASTEKSPVLETSEAGPLVKTASTPELQVTVGPSLPNLGQAEGLNETQNANADETEGPQSDKIFEKVKENL